MQSDALANLHLGLAMVAGLFLYVLATPLFTTTVGYGAWVRVEWIPLILFFWGQRRSGWPPLWVPWLFGLLVDVLRADPLGLNALCFLGMSWLLSARYEWFRGLALIRQCLALFVLLCVYAGVSLCVLFFSGRDLGVWWMTLLPPLITAALWPISTVLLMRVHARAMHV